MSLTGKTDTELDGSLSSGNFWPEIGLKGFQEVVRPPAEYKMELIRETLMGAIAAVNRALAPVEKGASEGSTLVGLSGTRIGDVPILELHYRQAVYYHTRAELLAHYTVIARKEDAENQAKELPETREYWMVESRRHIQFILEMTGHATEGHTVSGNGVYLI
uniref:Phage head completion protein (GPL) n=1 Tax=Candidatus Kentrum sp. LFY TaxID=2126342 RepID=A0A450WI35_9GAMM|nr:MAG: Phage head completion protein (GPL) [Candidatus Kentron sp. LFY]